MSNEDLEYRLMNGGLARISPMVFMNFLKICMTSFNEYGWRDWSLTESIPHITRAEWLEIYKYINMDELTHMINLYQDSNQIVPNAKYLACPTHRCTS